MLEKLMQAGRIGNLLVPTRLVFPPIQSRAADEQGMPTPRMAAYLAERGQAGVGLIIMQHSFCWPAAKLARGLALWDDACVQPLAALVDTVHASGAKLALQLGGRGTRQDNGHGSVAPSAVRLSYESEVPRELSTDEIAFFVESYGKAAQRVRAAGFDALEIHGAHGKMISQFLSPYCNRRTDLYGGSVEKRTRFPREILAAVRAAVGADFPVIFRLSLQEGFEGGLELAEGLEQVRILESAGVDAFHISQGGQEHVWNTDHSYFYPKMASVFLAEAAKKVTTKPIIAVSKIGDALTAEQILRDGQADFVALGRPLLADSQIVPKTLAGNQKSIRRCLYCLNCTTWPKRPELKERGIGCTVNPGLLREQDFAITPSPKSRSVLVVGGGLAGMEAARVAALRGHRVQLHEQSPFLGGQWRVASKAAYKNDFKSLIPWLHREMLEAGVQIHMNSLVNVELLDAQKPDMVLVATGANPCELTLERPREGGPEIVQALDVIMEQAHAGQKVVVIGGRYIGMEVAVQLAKQGKHVCLVEAQALGHGTIARLRGVYRNMLVENNVFIFDHSTVLRFTSSGLDIAHCASMLSLSADTVVLAIGTKPQQELLIQLQKLGILHCAIGDCKGIGDALTAMRAGAEAGRTV